MYMYIYICIWISVHVYTYMNYASYFIYNDVAGYKLDKYTEQYAWKENVNSETTKDKVPPPLWGMVLALDVGHMLLQRAPCWCRVSSYGLRGLGSKVEASRVHGTPSPDYKGQGTPPPAVG